MAPYDRDYLEIVGCTIESLLGKSQSHLWKRLAFCFWATA
jgi:hypothetical protein